jgi:hypothetical protein
MMATKKTKDVKVKFVGKNASYTVNKIRFDKRNPEATVDSDTAERLLKTGCFVILEEEEETPSGGAADGGNNPPEDKA